MKIRNRGEKLKMPQDFLQCITLPVPARGLRLAWKDTATDPVLVTFTVWQMTLPGMTQPKSKTYSGSRNLGEWRGMGWGRDREKQATSMLLKFVYWSSLEILQFHDLLIFKRIVFSCYDHIMLSLYKTRSLKLIIQRKSHLKLTTWVLKVLALHVWSVLKAKQWIMIWYGWKQPVHTMTFAINLYKYHRTKSYPARYYS